MGPGEEFDTALAAIHDAARSAGRDPASIQIEPRVQYHAGDVAGLVKEVDAWRELGASHLSITTMKAGLGPVEGHLDALTTIAGAVQLA